MKMLTPRIGWAATEQRLFLSAGGKSWHDVTDQRVRVYGDTAILNGTANVRMTATGQPHNGRMRATIVWVKRSHRWVRVSFQATRVQTTTMPEKQ